jgi:hypothetical protein
MYDESKVLDIKRTQRERWNMSSGYRFKTFAELSAEPVAKRWLIKNVLARGETSAWIAPPGAMKSALMAEASICVAAGLDWHGYRNKGAAGVLYFAIERADLVERRLRAHTKAMGAQLEPSLPILVSNAAVDLTKAEAFADVLATIRTAKGLGIDIGLVILDTFAKLVAIGGGDENSARDQGAIFGNIQKLKQYADIHVAIVGHTGKDETRGARGSNALLADVDVMVAISGEEIKTATVTKASDAPEGPLFSFKGEVHDFGTDEDGDPITVNIVAPTDAPQVATKGEPRLNANQKSFYRILHDAGSNGLTLEEWNAKAREVGIGTNRKAALYDLRKALEDRNMVREYGGIWKVNHG